VLEAGVGVGLTGGRRSGRYSFPDRSSNVRTTADLCFLHEFGNALACRAAREFVAEMQGRIARREEPEVRAVPEDVRQR
jgi:hypothetical protein